MYIRQATKNDLGAVLTCLRELNQSHVTYFNRKRVKQLLRQKCVGVAVSDTLGILGTCVIQENEGLELEIFAIAVRPEHQKSGIGVGSKLLRWAEAMARGSGCDFISADSYVFYNATPFYTKNGYDRFHAGEWGYTFYKYLPLAGGLDF